MPARSLVPALRLYLVLAAWAVWIGGFTFYFGVVVPIGGDVLSGSEQGFVTERVTNWQNLIGTAALALMLWQTIAAKDWLLGGAWLCMAVCLAALVAIHWRLEGMIDAAERTIRDSHGFRAWHERYEMVATVQWLAGMLYLGGIVRAATAGRF